MRPSIPSFTLPLIVWVSWFCAAPAAAGQSGADRFELRGIVINAATGKPVSSALVQMCCADQNAQFSGTDGTFVFTNIPRGQFTVTARKPGFFNEQELGRWGPGVNSLKAVPAEGDVVLKLTPEGIIYGEVKDESGEPVEGLVVRAQRWQVQDGRKRLQVAGDATSDDEGNFRVAELRPGSYYLAFVPANRGGRVTYSQLNRRKQLQEGYGFQFYPGVADLSSASAIEIRPGAQVHIAQTLSRQRLFEVSGVVRGANPENGFSLMLRDSAGNMVQRTVRTNSKTGEFQIQGVPAGTYMLSATALRQRGDDPPTPPLNATLPIHLNTDLFGLDLTLGAGISLGVHLHDEMSNELGSIGPHHVFVRMISKEFDQFSQGIVIPPPEANRGAPTRFEGLPPGIYTVEASPNQPGYVASLQCGGVDLLRDDLTLPPGSAPPPIEVTLRNDGAQLNVAVENGQLAGVVIFSEEYPRRSLLMQTNNTLSLANLAPGTYQVVALRDAQDLEFRNPSAMEKYLKHAGVVTLLPAGKATVRVEVQEPEEQ